MRSLVLAEAARSGVRLDKRQTAALNQLARGRPARFYKDALSYIGFLVFVGRATGELPFEDVCEFAQSAFLGGKDDIDRPFHAVRRKTHVVGDLF